MSYEKKQELLLDLGGITIEWERKQATNTRVYLAIQQACQQPAGEQRSF